MKTTSAAIEALVNSSDTSTVAMTTASVRSRHSGTMPSRTLAARLGMRQPARPQEERREANERERRRVGQHRHLGPAGRRQHAAKRRSGRHAGVARRLDGAVEIAGRSRDRAV